MTNDKRRLCRKSLVTAAIAIVASVVLLSLLYMVGTHRCLDKTLGFGQETLDSQLHPNTSHIHPYMYG